MENHQVSDTLEEGDLEENERGGRYSENLETP